MKDVFGMQLNKEQLCERVSAMRQICGARLITYQNGRAAGLKAVDVNAGSLRFTVLLDRGMDIGEASYNGVPVAWQSKVGVTGPAYFENQGHEWLRNFYGGLMTTCGLTHVGEPCQDGTVFHGLHGRISHTPAEKYWVDEYWDGDDYVVKVTGQMREAIIYEENLVLRREIKCIYGENKIYINDTVINEGYKESPLMIMYHVNQPFPIVSEHSRVYTSADSVDVVSAPSSGQPGAGDYSKLTSPQKNYQFETFVHNMPMICDKAYISIINEKLKMGVYLAYDPKALPVGNQWKMLGQQDYVVAIEPANTYNVGIIEAREKGYLPMLQPGQEMKFSLEFGILDGNDDIEKLKNSL